MLPTRIQTWPADTLPSPATICTPPPSPVYPSTFLHLFENFTSITQKVHKIQFVIQNLWEVKLYRCIIKFTHNNFVFVLNALHTINYIINMLPLQSCEDPLPGGSLLYLVSVFRCYTAFLGGDPGGRQCVRVRVVGDR